MKAVLPERAQAQRHDSKLPLFEFLRCRDLSFRVFELFAGWSAELPAYATNSQAHRTVPPLIHTKPGAGDRASKRLS